MRFTSFDGSLAPKVVQIIVSYNNLHAFFVIFRVFRGFFEIFGANFGLWACCSPTAEGCASLRASCSPPRWGGGELRAGVTPVLRKGIDIRAADYGGSRNERMRIAGLRGAEAAARTTLRVVFSFLCNLLTSKGCANRRQAEGNHACMNCRGAKEENKRSAVKSRRGETISGSVSRLR